MIKPLVNRTVWLIWESGWIRNNFRSLKEAKEYIKRNYTTPDGKPFAVAVKYQTFDKRKFYGESK